MRTGGVVLALVLAGCTSAALATPAPVQKRPTICAVAFDAPSATVIVRYVTDETRCPGVQGSEEEWRPVHVLSYRVRPDCLWVTVTIEDTSRPLVSMNCGSPLGPLAAPEASRPVVHEAELEGSYAPLPLNAR